MMLNIKLLAKSGKALAVVFSIWGLLIGMVACQKSKKENSSSKSDLIAAAEAEKEVVKKALPIPKGALLMSRAQFEWRENSEGKRVPNPLPAKLTWLNLIGEEGQLEDKKSKVFHKAVCRGPKDAPGSEVWTIGATEAHLKRWTIKEGQWVGESIWGPSFGGKWDRLRDMEWGDLDGDGLDDIVVATHDQGVVATLMAMAVKDADGNSTISYKVSEIFRRKDTFVHEIELGDLDGDGRLEIYATPSAPNSADHSQGGEVIQFRWDAGSETYEMTTIASFAERHAKEILVSDVDGDGHDELYISLEAKTKKLGKGGGEALAIWRYDWLGKRKNQAKAKWKKYVIAHLNAGVQARVLLKSVFRSKNEAMLIVTTWKDGIWGLVAPPAKMAKRSDKPWGKLKLSDKSSGFEHAAGVFDLDGDGLDELYVAADDQDEIQRLSYDATAKGAKIVHRVLSSTPKNDITWSVEFCQ